MKKLLNNKFFNYGLLVLIIAGAGILGLSKSRKTASEGERHETSEMADFTTIESREKEARPGNISEGIPVYGNWKTFTKEDGLPDDKCYAVRIDSERDRVMVGTHHGLAVYQDGKWTTYTTKDGLAHNGIVSIDVSVLTGDVWIGTLGGLNRWSGGKFETFNQFNSGMPNDLV